MQPEDLFDAARARARRVEVPKSPDDDVLERLRTDCAAWFDQVPEPPVYRRLDDPARRTAEALIPAGQELLARTLALSRHAPAESTVKPLIDALEAHLATLCHTAEGRLERAEQEWHRALSLERAIGQQNRLFVRSDEDDGPRPVFDRASRQSRYDPGEELSLTVKLVCPNRACRFQERYKTSPRYSTHRFNCPRCKKPFVGYFGEVRAVERERKQRLVHYLFDVEELGGALAQVEFDEKSGAEFGVARRDLVAFLYDTDRDLKAVLNLSSGRVLWVHRGTGCFIVTAAYGEQAPELAAFRAFRDLALLPNPLGRALVRGYYAVGPQLARVVRASPRVQRSVRRVLGQVHQWLISRGYR